MPQTPDLVGSMDRQFDQALRDFVSKHPEARPDQYVIVFIGAEVEVIGTFADGEKANHAAFQLRPNGAPHICQIGANQYTTDYIRSSRKPAREL